MIGILIELLLSWALLWAVEHRSLEALGLYPTARRFRLAAAGFLFAMIFMIAYQLGEAAILRTPYHFNRAYGFPQLGRAMWFLLKSVLFEELIFRGAILYILVRKVGERKAVLASAVAFGIYHFFVVGIYSPMQALILFLTTAWLGYVLAIAFVRIGSIWIPIAIHYSLNLTPYVGFSQSNGMGDQWFVHTTTPHPPIAITLGLLVVHNFVFPLIVLWWLDRVRPHGGLQWVTGKIKNWRS
ncbi:MAG TPA: CPBP family intramembrane glutamic endopeptidase [Puia sp.]|nr:CPBP family intramembrane glutamic endopeptidase [Puia sp.]